MRRLAPLALLLLAGACHRAPAIDAKPALWRVRDADTTIWLLGTIHVLPDNVRWQTPAIRQAIDASDALVMELPDDPAGTTATFARAGTASGLPPIAERLSPMRRGDLAAALAAGGLDADAVDGKKSWAAAFVIAGAPNAKQGITREHGVEAAIAARFAERHRPSGRFETAAGQFAILDALPEAAQRVLLDRAVADAAHGGREYRATLAAWAAGDTARMAATLDPAFRASPALEQALVAGRNRRWSAKIAARMAKPGRVLVAVGAGHFVGPDSLLAMLRARGLKVERVE